MKSIHRILCKKLFFFHRFYLCLLPIFGIGVLYCYKYCRILNQAKGQFSFIVYHGIFQNVVVMFVIIPSFLVIIGLISNDMDKCEVLLKYKDVREWWADKNWGTCFFSIIYIAVINTVVIGVILFSGHSSQINFSFLNYMFFGCLFQLFGFLILGNVYSIISLETQRPYAGFIITYVIFAMMNLVKNVLESLLSFDFATLEEYMFLMLDNISVLHLIWLVFIYILIYKLGSAISKDKDIYWGVQ